MISFPKSSLVYLILLWSVSLNSQTPFAQIDSIAENAVGPFSGVDDLATQLTQSLDSDLDKAKVFYVWIGKNVRYDCKKYHENERIRLSAGTEAGMQRKLQAYRKQQVEDVIRRKKGVCEDYSRLYKALCDEAGVEAKLITGTSRNPHRPYRNKQSNAHAWNAIKIDGKWYLLDSTWGAGTTDAKVTKFRRRLSMSYFMTSPELFILNHLPDEKQWQLLDQPINKKAFVQQPLINYGDADFQIKAFAPSTESVNNRQQQIWLVFENAPKFLALTTKKQRRIDCKRVEKEGKTILIFTPPGSKEVLLFGGNSKRGRMKMLARYRL